MVVKVIFPADCMGGKEEAFLFFPKATFIPDVLIEVRAAFEDISETGLPAKSNTRPMMIGDIIQIEEKKEGEAEEPPKFYIVGVRGFRRSSEASVNVWRKKTKVERLTASGHHESVKSGHHVGIIVS